MAGVVCIYYGNTGSSWLVEMLSWSPDVLVPGFEPVEDWAWDADTAAKLAWMDAALDPPVGRSGPEYDSWVETLQASPQVQRELVKPSFLQVCFKLKDLAAHDPEAVAEVLHRAQARVILLTRSNRIKHALSLYRYHEEGKSQFDGKDDRPPTHVRLGRFHRWLRESERLHDRSQEVRAACVDRLGEEAMIDVAYEDFVTEEGKRDLAARLASFLGIAPGSGVGSYRKATPDDIRSAVINYRLLRLRYLPTRYRGDFED